MTRTADTTRRTHRHAAAAAILALLGGLFAIGATAPVASAEENVSGYGYKKVWDSTEYLSYHVARDKKILHVDTEHPQRDGFWFAHRYPYDRGIAWTFQPYGMACDGQVQTVTWNPWLNQFSCLLDHAQAQTMDPQWDQVTAACREDSGLPWLESKGNTDSACSDRVLRPDTSIRQAGSITKVCAPWEPSRCQGITYPWMDNKPNSAAVFWLPAPDACTGMPADTALTSPDPADHAPTSGDGSCTGEAPAPNCETAPEHIRTGHQACTGVEPPAPKFYDASTTLVETQTFERRIEVTRWAKARSLKARKVRWVKRHRYGRAFRARGVGKRFIVRWAKATHRDQMTGEVVWTATAECTLTTSQAAADACADERAREALDTAVPQRRLDGNVREVRSELAAAAKQHARNKAKRKARIVPTTNLDRRIAVRKAKRIALRKVRYRIRNYA